MIVGIPTDTAEGLDAPRCGHFGHAPFFTLATIEDGTATKLEVYQNIDHGQYGCGGVIEYAISLGMDAMIAVGMGLPPLTRFTNAGIKVYSDQVHPTVREVLIAFLNDELQLMDPANACRH